MDKLNKIKDVSARYKVTTSTLRYYEKMGLIKSSRCENSGYRLYDEETLVRLRQILILRKMNISINDIRELLAAKHSDAVLAILDKKVENIDGEVARLYELKEIVLAFIRQIRQINFHDAADVKRLFDKAMEIEISLTETNADMGNLFDTSDVLDEHLTEIAIENKISATPITLNKFEIVKRDSCKFIGKSVYAREHGKGSNELFKYFREQNKWVFDELDMLKEYATDEIYNAALKTWDFYMNESHTVHDLTFSENGMVGYHIGRFMKADSPVPEGMDSIDIPQTHIAKGWAQSEPRDSIFYLPKLGDVYEMMQQEADKLNYELTSWILMADIFSEPDENGVSHFGQYISCRPKS